MLLCENLSPAAVLMHTEIHLCLKAQFRRPFLLQGFPKMTRAEVEAEQDNVEVSSISSTAV